jgi:NAD+ synthase
MEISELTSRIRLTPDVLKIDAEKVSRQIESFIREKMKELQRDGIILGLSGGLDSVVVAYLSARSVGPDKVLGLYMPERDSNPKHGEDAKWVADELGIKFQVEDLTPVLYQLKVYDSLPIKYLPNRKLRGLAIRLGKYVREKISGRNLAAEHLVTKDKLVGRGIAYGHTKHMVRLAVLFRYAKLRNLLITGAANKTEYLQGIFTQWGCDGQADIMPIRNLYRTQVEQLAEYLGVPQRIIDKPADPDVMPGIENKGNLFGPFETLDLILHGLESGLSPEEMCEQFSREEISRVITQLENSKHMREGAYVPDLII